MKIKKSKGEFCGYAIPFEDDEVYEIHTLKTHFILVKDGQFQRFIKASKLRKCGIFSKTFVKQRYGTEGYIGCPKELPPKPKENLF